MFKKYLLGIILEILGLLAGFYFMLPALNPSSMSFWGFLFYGVVLYIVIFTALRGRSGLEFLKDERLLKKQKFLTIPMLGMAGVVIIILITNLICSPLFNAKSYSNRIEVDKTGNFSEDIKEVDFNTLPLLDRASSEKLGDRVMGQMSEFVSQYYVSEQYTQINYNDEIVRVTPLEYGDIIKWFSNRKEGVKGYITVNSVNGEAKLIKLKDGMKYMPSAHFNEKLERKLRFSYPTTIFGEAKFEIDNEGNPFWVVPTYSYTAFNLKTKVTGIVVLDPITGNSTKYSLDKVPEWVDNAYNAELIIEQVDDWGSYKKGFFNSIFGQKDVVKTTDGYNYLAMDNDIYLYTGITSVVADESNLGFILTNMRTGKTMFYSVPGAEEYSAMSSAEGQVQQMNYDSTFPLLINLNNKPTYLVSLKDDAGLVKMYGFIDVADYQKVVVTDASLGIEASSIKYLESYAGEVNENVLEKKEIIVKSMKSAVKGGNTTYYITDENTNKYMASIKISDELPFINAGDKITIGFYKNKKGIVEINKIY